MTTETVDPIQEVYSLLQLDKLGNDIFSNELRSRGVVDGNNLRINTNDLNYYKNVLDQATKTRIGYYGLNDIFDPYSSINYVSPFQNYPGHYLDIDGNRMVYMPYEVGAKVGYDKATGKITMLSDVAGNEDFFKYGKVFALPKDILAKVSEGLAKQNNTNWVSADYKYDTPGLGYLFSESDYDKYIWNNLTKNATDYTSVAPWSWTSGDGNVSSTNDLYNAWLIRNKDIDLGGVPEIGAKLESTPWVAQSSTNPKTFLTYDPKDATKTGPHGYDQWGNWAADFLGSDLGQAVSVLGNIYTLGLSGALTSAINATKTGEWGDALLNTALAYANVSGVTPSIGKELGFTGNVAKAVGSGVTNFGAGLLRGQDFEKALQSGVISGLSNYAGSSLSDLGAFDSKWANNALGTVGSIATGYGLNSLFNNQDNTLNQSYNAYNGSIQATSPSAQNTTYGSNPVVSSLNPTDSGALGSSTSPVTKPMTTSTTPGVATDSATSDYGGLEAYVSGDWKPQTEEQP